MTTAQTEALTSKHVLSLFPCRAPCGGDWLGDLWEKLATRATFSSTNDDDTDDVWVILSRLFTSVTIHRDHLTVADLPGKFAYWYDAIERGRVSHGDVHPYVGVQGDSIYIGHPPVQLFIAARLNHNRAGDDKVAHEAMRQSMIIVSDLILLYVVLLMREQDEGVPRTRALDHIIREGVAIITEDKDAVYLY